MVAATALVPREQLPATTMVLLQYTPNFGIDQFIRSKFSKYGTKLNYK